jgi:hypothetical protein
MVRRLIRGGTIQPVGPIIRTFDEVPLWIKPGIEGSIRLIVPVLNVAYNWTLQRLMYQSVGEFLSDNRDTWNE